MLFKICCKAPYQEDIRFSYNFLDYVYKCSDGQLRKRLSVTVEVLRVGVMIAGVISVGVMTVGVLSVGVMTLFRKLAT
jgi:hypothetical protein